MCGIAVVIETVRGCTINKPAIFLVDEQRVFGVQPLLIARIAHINVEPAIGIDVYHHDAGTPFIGFGNARRLGGICKTKAAFVDVQFVGTHVGGKNQVGQVVVVYVANGHTTAVVKIAVAKNVEIFVVGNVVGERYAGAIGRHQGKQCFGCKRPGRLGLTLHQNRSAY